MIELAQDIAIIGSKVRRFDSRSTMFECAISYTNLGIVPSPDDKKLEPFSAGQRGPKLKPTAMTITRIPNSKNPKPLPANGDKKSWHTCAQEYQLESGSKQHAKSAIVLGVPL